MKFVLFADKSYNYIKPLANGLLKMLEEAGQECIIYDHGIYWLSAPHPLKILLGDLYRFFLMIKSGKPDLYIYRFWPVCTFLNRKRKKQLQACDCIIIVQHCPSAFYKDFKRVETLRKYNKPIVNYDLNYLPNQGWYKKIKERNPANWGLERYDWYLPASIVTEFALPAGIPDIYSTIGFDIRKDDLYPEQEEFIALIDFARPGYETARAIQIQALQETSTPYIELKGRYTTNDIRKIYRRSCLYFLSFRESFGLPILELQLCGCTIFTPFREWAPAHFLNKDIHKAGTGDLGSNFYVYNNDLDTLKQQIRKLKSTYNAKRVIENFRNEYPFYYQGNKRTLADFLQKLHNREIHARSHEAYKDYNRFISLEDDVYLFEQ